MQDEYATSIGHKVIKLLKHEGYEVRYVSSAYYIDKHSNYESISFDFMREANYFGKDTRNDEETLKSIDIYNYHHLLPIYIYNRKVQSTL